MRAVRDWHNEHSFTTVPAGLNPCTGEKLTDVERDVIACSAKPTSVHENLMAGLRKDLTEEQVEKILDLYTIGKYQFTLKGFKAIVTDITDKEEQYVISQLRSYAQNRSRPPTHLSPKGRVIGSASFSGFIGLLAGEYDSLSTQKVCYQVLLEGNHKDYVHSKSVDH